MDIKRIFAVHQAPFLLLPKLIYGVFEQGFGLTTGGSKDFGTSKILAAMQKAHITSETADRSGQVHIVVYST